MPFFFKLLCFFSLSLVLAGSLGAAAQGFQGTSSLGFIQNQGQLTDTDGRPTPDILFQANLNDQTIYLRKTGISYVLSHYEEMASQEANRDNIYKDEDDNPKVKMQLHRVDVDFLGANPGSVVYGEDLAGPYFNYYYPHCPDGIEQVPSFKKIIYKGLYPHVDLVFYFSEEDGAQGLKYDFIVHPGGDIRKIRMKYTGAENIFIDDAGRLNALTTLGSIVEHSPVAYQGKNQVECLFKLAGEVLIFKVGDFDPDSPLTIDPFVRIWATFIGGSSSENGAGVVSDSMGNAFVTGSTQSIDFPSTTGAFQTSKIFGPDRDGFITRFDSSGSLLWSTYYGATDNTQFLDIDIYNSSELYICGYAGNGFPTLNAFQGSNPGLRSGVLLKFTANGTRLWATYLGGSGYDHLYSLVVGNSGDVYVTGQTTSPNFPISTGAFRDSITGTGDGIAFKFSNNGSRLWSTYLGGGLANDLDVGMEDDIYITGSTQNRSSFPVTTNAYQPSLMGTQNAFVIILDSSGAQRYGSFLGNYSTSLLPHISVNENGEYFHAGSYRNDSFPVSQNGLLRTPGNNNSNLYVIKFSTSHTFLWGSYFGLGLFWDLKAKGGKVVATGVVNTLTFPVTKHSFQTNLSASSSAFILELDYSGNRHYASYYSGAYYGTYGYGIDYNPLMKSLYLTGSTRDDFPVTSGAFQTVMQGGTTDAFLVKFTECFFPTEIDADTTTIFCRGDSVQLKADTGHSVYYWSNFDTVQQTWVHEEGNYWVRITDSSGCAAFDTVNIKITPDEFYNSPQSFHTTVDSTSSSEGKVLLTWPPDSLENNFVSHYRLYYRHHDSTSFLVLADSIPFTQSTFLHENINTANKKHFYYLERLLACGEVSDSATVYSPVSLTFNIGQLIHDLTWTPYQGRSTTHYIIQELRGNNWINIDTVPGTDTTWTKMPAPCNYAVTYRIKAESDSVYFSYSNTATNQALDTIPADAPLLGFATLIDSNVVKLDFSGADSLDIYAYDIRRMQHDTTVSAGQIPFTAPGGSFVFYDTLSSFNGPLCYAVFSLDSCLNETSSDTFCIIILTGEGGQSANYLNWHPYRGLPISGYVLQKSDGTGWTSLATPVDTFFTDTPITCEVSSDYRVFAISGSDTSFSNTITLTPLDTIPPVAPVLKSASVLLNQTIELNWFASKTKNPHSFEIWKDDGSGFVLLNSTTDSFYVDNNVNPKIQTYSYYIIQTDTCSSVMQSAPSDTDRTMNAEATTGACVPLINVSWNAYADLPQGVDAYRIWKMDTGGFSPIETINSNFNNYTDSNVLINTNYCFRIEALDTQSGFSAFSDTVCIAPWVYPEPDTATMVRATVERTDDISGDILVEWERANVADTFVRGYFLYHGTFSAAGPFTLLDDVTDLNQTNYLHQGIDTRSTRHYYKIVVYNVCVAEGENRETHRPINLEFNNRNLNAEIYWSYYEGFPIQQYELRRSIDGQPYQTLAVFGPTDSSFIDSTLRCGHDYAWQLFGHNYNYNLITASDSVWGTAFDTIPPAAPQLQVASVSGPDAVDVQFIPVLENNRKGYYLYQNVNGTGFLKTDSLFNNIDPVLNFNKTGLAPSQNNYSYYITTMDSCGNESSPSDTHTVVRLQATAQNAANNIAWNHYSGFENWNYELQRKTTGNWDVLQLLNSNESTFIDSNIICDTLYFYRILTLNNDTALISYSNEDTVRAYEDNLPEAPGLARVTVEPTGEVLIEFNASVSADAASYIVWRKGAGSWQIIASGITNLNYADLTAMTTDSSYEYRLQTLDSCGNASAFSQIHRTILLTATPANERIELAWNAYQGWPVAVYRIFRDGALFDSTTAQTYTDSGLTCTSLHTYRIEAVADSTVALVSSSNDATERALDSRSPAAPALVSASVDQPNETVELLWQPSPATDVAQYQIWQKPMGITDPTLTATLPADEFSLIIPLPGTNQRWCFLVTAQDSCGNNSPLSNPGCIIMPEVTAADGQNLLQWQDYEQWPATGHFEIY
ncbi:MAG: SBBP repeat-containing protein, partial [Bacteroidia bacterium]